MCGEHTFAELDAIRVEGSSPHVRGAPLGKAYGCASIGIIPACAGSTRLPRAALRLIGAHPRMCGEHRLISYDTLVCEGIIPACAGSTEEACMLRQPLRDHPRMCGEHTSIRTTSLHP